MPLKQKHIEKIFGIAYRAGLTSALVQEVEAILAEIMDSREDNRLSIQDLLDALSEFMELDYSCADLSTRPKMLPKFVGLAPHVADLVDLADAADEAPEQSPSSPRHDGDDSDASAGDPGHALAKRPPVAASGSEGSGEDESSDDEGWPDNHKGRSGDDEASNDDDESGEDNELTGDEDEELTGDVYVGEPSEDDDEDTSEDEDPRGPRQEAAEPVEEVGLE